MRTVTFMRLDDGATALIFEVETFRGRVHALTFIVPEALVVIPEKLKACGFVEYRM